MDVLFDIPVAGLFFQLVDYLIVVLTTNGAIILALAAPIALGSYCGLMNERSGVVNIGIEGMMIAAAFAGWFAASLVVQAFPEQPKADFAFGATPALLIGLLAAVVTGMAVSAIHAWLSITVRADQIISGTIINIVALGVTGYLIIIISSSAPPSAGKFTTFVPPQWLTDLPLVGWLFDMFLNQGPITMSVLLLAVVLQVLLFRSRWGLRTRAVGEHPRAAETVGVDAHRPAVDAVGVEDLVGLEAPEELGVELDGVVLDTADGVEFKQGHAEEVGAEVEIEIEVMEAQDEFEAGERSGGEEQAEEESLPYGHRAASRVR